MIFEALLNILDSSMNDIYYHYIFFNYFCLESDVSVLCWASLECLVKFKDIISFSVYPKSVAILDISNNISPKDIATLNLSLCSNDP